MSTISSSLSVSRSAPPLSGRAASEASFEEPQDLFTPSEAKPHRGPTSKGLFGLMAAAALTLAPQMAQAADLDSHLSQAAPETSTLFERHEVGLGDYTLRFEPVDVDLSPKLAHGVPGLRLKGELMETSLARTTDLGDGWSATQGLRGKLLGDFRTYDDSRVNLGFEAFKRWEGPVGRDMHGEFEFVAGTNHEFLERGTEVGAYFRQEVTGGDFQFWNQPLAWHLEGRQGYRHNLDQGEGGLYYNALVGVRRDFEVEAFGRRGTISTIVGPEFSGNQDHSFEVSPKLKVRLRLH